MALRILLIDDDPDIRALIRRWLESDGHVVTEAIDGHGGLRALQGDAYDVAFIDIVLPGLDGYEIARRMRALSADRRPCLVALTAVTDDVETAFEAGFDAHVLKPVEAQTIAAVLNDLPQMTGKKN